MTMSDLICDDIRQTLQPGATLLDVRTAGEFSSGALPNARNIPLSILPTLAHEHLDKNEHVFIYCRPEGRAIIAEKILAGLGFKRITNIGGMYQYHHRH
jgi:rhodanese-related sulfurtransferase